MDKKYKIWMYEKLLGGNIEGYDVGLNNKCLYMIWKI